MEPPTNSSSHPHAAILMRMAQLWGCTSEEYARAVRSNRPYLLCTHPVNLRHPNLADIRQAPYVVGDKTDGERRFLLLDTDAKTGQQYTCTVDRKCVVTLLPSVRVTDRGLYNGTLLDCEYVPPEATMVALDLVAVKGVTACHAPHAKRMGALHAVIPSIQTDGWRIVPKAWYPLSALPSIPGAEGLIFVPAEAGMRYGTCKDVFKWKAVHTIDFLLTPDGRLMLFTAGRPVDVSTQFVLCYPSADVTTQLTSYHTSGGRIIECSLHPPPDDDGRPDRAWQARYLKDRPDKTTPNDTTTLHSTLESIRVKVERSYLNRAICTL
jgi:hypothetical protein